MIRTLVFLLSLLTVGTLQAEIPGHFYIQNFDSFRHSLRLNYRFSKPNKKVKVAILDNGFAGYEDALGVSLHHKTQFIAGKEPNRASVSPHGRIMAQILYAFTTNQGRFPDLAPEVYLLEAGGFTNFRSAIDKAIDLKVDYILHAVSRDYGSNFDGTGFWNAEMNRAIEAGILWVNSAGNYRKSTVNLESFETNEQKQVVMPGPDGTIPVTCMPTAGLEVCPFRLVLSWNDFTEDPHGGTNKDLDIHLQIKQGETYLTLETSRKVQIEEGEVQLGQSKYPREIIETELSKGLYYIRVANSSSNFSEGDKLRLVGFGQGVHMSYYDQEENLIPVADHPEAITVGAADSELSSESKALGKPNYFMPSVIDLGFDRIYAGSSNAAAIWLAFQIHRN